MVRMSQSKVFVRGITVSVVSHGHGRMVWELVWQLLSFPEISKIVLTINTPEHLPDFHDPRLVVIFNLSPKGFGENHNEAFKRQNSSMFCVLNPDITFRSNPFQMLERNFEDKPVGLVAPQLLDPDGNREDNFRTFLTPFSLIKRALGFYERFDAIGPKMYVEPDWVSGTFMLFRSDIFAEVGGFNESYYMYCEDADICTRLWKLGYQVLGSQSVAVTHNAQRASRHNCTHFFWHVRSMARYFLSHLFRFPNKGIATRSD